MAVIADYSVRSSFNHRVASINYHTQGRPLSDRDKLTVCEAFRLQLALAYDLLSLPNVNQFRSWIFSSRELDVMMFGRFVSNLDTALKNYAYQYELGLRWDYQSFKHSNPELKGYWGYITPIRQYVDEYLSSPQSSSFRVINQWLNFTKRLNLRDLDLSEQLLEEYLSFEDKLQQQQYDRAITDELNEIIRDWFGSFHDWSSFRPKHGPGAVAGHKGRPSIAQKHLLLSKDQRLVFLQKYLGDLESYSPSGFITELERCSDIVFVPKSLITNRTISKEPVALQYFQQGVMDEMVSYVHQHKVMRKHISFSDQTLSAEAARLGSIWGEYATIDLSSASDSVTYTLVKRVFRGTWLLPFMVCTRSDFTRLPNGAKIRLEKYAPMGSALCFPTETVLFAAICELASRRTGGDAYYRVFGDDIVISQSACDEVVQLLTSLHFRVNDTKSFSHSKLCNFREACGGEYFNGDDVTPLRISRQFRMQTRLTYRDADRISALISFANQAMDFGFLHLRLAILELISSTVDKYVAEKLLYSNSGLVGLKAFPGSCTNFRVQHRWNARLFREECKGFTPCAKLDKRKCSECRKALDAKGLQCDDIRYFEWLRVNFRRSNCDDLSSESLNICPAISEMRSSWSIVD